MRILRVKRLTIPKIAVLATGLAVAGLVATLNPAPAQAFTGKTEVCTGCHTAGGSVTATSLSPTVASGAAYTVALDFTGGTSPNAFWISGNGANVTGSGATSASMTAPVAAGSYTYTVWVRSGVAASTTYTITVGAATTTAPATTAPVTTAPVTTAPVTTAPVTTAPVTTAPVTTAPVTTAPVTTVPPVGTLPVIKVGEDDLSPTSLVGAKHLSMYTGTGATCAGCHSAAGTMAPPAISGEGLTMGGNTACGSCHAAGKEEPTVFVAQMKPAAAATTTTPTYGRCNTCHTVVSDGDSDEGDSHDGDSDKGDSHDGDSHDGDSHDGESHAGESHAGDWDNARSHF